MPIGGILDMRMFSYPETPKYAAKWTMRKINNVKDSLKNLPYPDPTI